jgi:hypothetical protein
MTIKGLPREVLIAGPTLPIPAKKADFLVSILPESKPVDHGVSPRDLEIIKESCEILFP